MNKRKERKKIELKNKLKVEERYYNPPFLNKWFGIVFSIYGSSILR